MLSNENTRLEMIRAESMKSQPVHRFIVDIQKDAGAPIILVFQRSLWLISLGMA